MSGPAATGGTPGDPGGGAPAPLTPSAVEAVLADFRRWLEGLANPERERRGGDDNPVARAPGSPETVDLFTLVGQFTALRHDAGRLPAPRALQQLGERLGDAGHPRRLPF